MPVLVLALAACHSASIPDALRPPDAPGDTSHGDDTAPADDSAEVDDSAGDDTGSVGTGVLEGTVPDEGFGAALAFEEGGALLIGAPFAATGRVVRVDTAGVTTVLSGPRGLGATVASTPAGPVAGSPWGDGAVVGLSGVLAVGDKGSGTGSLGLALVPTPAGWIAAHARGWRGADGATDRFTTRPSAVAVADGTVAVGFAFGEVAVLLPSPVPRSSPDDQLGFALVALQADGDAGPEWAVGAPGVDMVQVRDGDGTLLFALEAPEGLRGRFGASLAAADVDGDGLEDLVVGAPMAGATVAGAAAWYRGGAWEAPASTWTGLAAEDQLGFAVAATHRAVALGAPGGAGSPGSVRVVAVD